MLDATGIQLLLNLDYVITKMQDSGSGLKTVHVFVQFDQTEPSKHDLSFRDMMHYTMFSSFFGKFAIHNFLSKLPHIKYD